MLLLFACAVPIYSALYWLFYCIDQYFIYYLILYAAPLVLKLYSGRFTVKYDYIIIAVLLLHFTLLCALKQGWGIVWPQSLLSCS